MFVIEQGFTSSHHCHVINHPQTQITENFSKYIIKTNCFSSIHQEKYQIVTQYCKPQMQDRQKNCNFHLMDIDKTL